MDGNESRDGTMAGSGTIRVGVAGWDYPDWSGLVYPAPAPRGFDRLAYLAGLFDAIELNVTFYRQPEPRASRSWAARVAASRDFRFTAKLHQSLTHAGRTPGSSSPPTAGDLDLPALRADADRYREGIDPLREAGILGAVLMQFPQSFHDLPASRRHLETLAGLLHGLPLVAEVRHNSWNHDEALRFLAGLGLGFCNVDQPRLGSTLPPTGHVTSRVAYIRLHGRNAENWFRPRAGDGEGGRDAGALRYDYLYAMDELRPWIERAGRLADRAEEVFLIANNHYRGKAVANALMVKSVLTGRRVPAPRPLVAACRELGDLTVPEPSPDAQGRLF